MYQFTKTTAASHATESSYFGSGKISRIYKILEIYI